MIANPSFPANTESARVAFLEGVEHRGQVLAEAQCGDASLARSIVAACTVAFRDQAANTEPRRWALLFWRALLAEPALRARLAPQPRNPFSQLAPGPRAALLLKRVAELDPEQSADVLNVTPATYRHALDHALETIRAKGIDDAVAHFVRIRLQSEMPARATANPATGTAAIATVEWMGAARRFRPALIVATGVMLLALLVSFFWLPGFLRHGSVSASGFQTLRGDAPAATLSATESAISDADFDLLTDPQGARIARDLDLYAWYAASSNGGAATTASATPPPEASLPEASTTEADGEDPLESASAAVDSSASGHAAAASPKSSSGRDGDAH